MKVFFSYGHDDHADFVTKVKEDLKKYDIDVWMDSVELRAKSDWEITIEKGIEESDEIVYFITPHSARRPDGYCLNELAFSIANTKQITPVMIEYITPPLSICRIQYLDIQDLIKNHSDTTYEQFIKSLVSAIKDKNVLGMEGGHINNLKNIFDPIDFSYDIKRHIKSFVGREWLYEKVDSLLLNSENNLLWITGEAGFGKSAFSTYLSHNHPSIVGIHFCTHDNQKRKDAKSVLKTLVYQLSTQINEYKDFLYDVVDLKIKLNTLTANEILEEFLIQPLNKINETEKCFFVIDALDESEQDGKNELADLIQKFSHLPHWIKIVVTSRPEPYLKRKLSKLKMIELDAHSQENIHDLKQYIKSKSKDKFCEDLEIDSIAEVLIKKSEGNILYLKEVIESISNGEISLDDLDNLPKGMDGLYLSMFSRYFTDIDSYKALQRPLLELISASSEPLDLDFIMKVLNWDDYDLEDALEPIGSLIEINNNTIKFFHKSIIDWITNREKSGRDFFVSLKKGHEKIAKELYTEFKVSENKLSNYAIKYMSGHLNFINEYEQFSEVLQSQYIIDKRIELLSLDSTVRILLNDLYILSVKDFDLCSQVFKSKMFLDMFARQRRFFYNSGLYFELKKAGFDKILENKEDNWGIDSEIAIAFYYYITEDFIKTIKKINELFDSDFELSDNSINIELYNVIGLCYRKLVEFDKAKESFLLVLEASEVNNNFFEASIAACNIGKIDYHTFNFDLAKINTQNGIDLLNKTMEEKLSSDKLKSNQLFLAEYYRLYAEALLWNFEVDEAQVYLDKSDKIYSSMETRDRYYVRWLYTSSFVEILKGNYKYCIDNYSTIFNLTKNQYDKAQIEFLYSLSLLIDLIKTKKDDVSDTLNKNINSAINRNNSIKAFIEKEEAQIILDLFNNYKNNSSVEFIQRSHDNKFIENWANYVLKFIKRILTNEKLI